MPSLMMDLTPEFLFPRNASGVADFDLVARGERFADDVESIMVSFRRGLDEIRTGGSLTALGQAQASGTAAQRVAGKIMAAADVAMRPVKGAVEEGERLLRPEFRHRIPAGVDAADTRQVEGEIRARLAGMQQRDPVVGQIEVDAIYSNACAAGDWQTVRAIEQAPRSFPLVSAELIERGADRFAAAVRPDRWARLQQERALLSQLSDIVDSATRWIEQLSGHRTRPDPIEVAAATAAAEAADDDE